MKTLLMMALIATVPVTPAPVTASPVTAAVASLEAAIVEQNQVIAQLEADAEAALPVLGPAQNVEVTFYYAKSGWGARTASGAIAFEGAVAADKSLPFGTILYIPELSFIKEDGLFVVLDRGSAIKGNIIDVFLSEAAGYPSVARRARAYGRMFNLTAYQVAESQ